MEIDTERIDEAVLALLLLGLHDGGRVWKSFDWDAMERLHQKGLITDPVGKAKSVVLTEEGQREAERLFARIRGAPMIARPHTATGSAACAGLSLG